MMAYVFARWSAQLWGKKVEPHFCHPVGLTLNTTAILVLCWHGGWVVQIELTGSQMAVVLVSWSAHSCSVGKLKLLLFAAS